MGIVIDKKEYSSTKWFAGIFTDAAGYKHTFNIVVDYDDHPKTARVDDVQWAEEPPKLDEESNKIIEQQIKDTFYAK